MRRFVIISGYEDDDTNNHLWHLPILKTFFDGTFGISPQVASVTAAFYNTLYHEERSSLFHTFKLLGSKTEFTASESAVRLLHLSRKFVEETHIKGSETDFAQISEYLKTAYIHLETNKRVPCDAQIIIFDQNSGNLLEMLPKMYNESVRPLFLLAEKQESKLVPTSIITNIQNYFENSKFGFYCFFCKNRYSGKGSKHRCRKRRSCFACHRYLLEKTTYTNVVTKNLFCNDEMEPKVKDFCKECNLSIRNESCFKTHRAKILSMGMALSAL